MSRRLRSLVAISDFRDGWPPEPTLPPEVYRQAWQNDTSLVGLTRLHSTELERLRQATQVVGGYMERLPLACIKAGVVDYAEKWHYNRRYEANTDGWEQPLFGWRSFHLPHEAAPLHSTDMLEYIRVCGAPDILCIWGLGVSEAILEACVSSFKIYYSLDAPPLRVPPEVSRHFDLVLVGGEWQKAEVLARHPKMTCEILTLGPEFADPQTFRPLPVAKEYDLVYVACAQPYKRHDLLFEGMARSSRHLRALCVIGYGSGRPELERISAELAIDVTFTGPPGFSYAEINAFMNQARIGVVAGVEDGCPAILTEYMLAGLPVLANADLCCGLRFITPRTGLAASANAFHLAIEEILDNLDRYNPRNEVLSSWRWEHSVRQLIAAIQRATKKA